MVMTFFSKVAVSQSAEKVYNAQLDECMMRKSVPCLKYVVKEINYCIENGIVKFASFDDRYKDLREIFWENKEYELIPGMLDLDIENKMKFPKFSSVSFVDSLLRNIMFKHYVQELINNPNTIYLDDYNVTIAIDSEIHLLRSYSQSKIDSICELFLQLHLDAFEKGFLSNISGSRAKMKQLVSHSSDDLYLLYFSQMCRLFTNKIKENNKDPKDLENEEACARFVHNNIYRMPEIKSKSNENVSTYLFFCIDYLSFFKTVDSMNKFVKTDYQELLHLCKKKLGNGNIILPYLSNNIGNAFHSLYDSTQNQCYLDSTKKYLGSAVTFWLEQIRMDKRSRQSYGKDDTVELIGALDNLANVLKLKGDLGFCDATYTSIIKYNKMKFGENSEDYAVSLYKAATIEIEIKNYKSAERKLLSLVATHKLTTDNYFSLDWVLGGYSSLSRLSVKLDNFKEAKLYFEAAISIANRVSGNQNHSNAIDFDYIYGSLYNDGGFIFSYFGKEKHDTSLLLQAEQDYKIALSFRIKKGEKDPLYLTTLVDYAALIGYLGDRKKQDKCIRYIESVKDSL